MRALLILGLFAASALTSAFGQIHFERAVLPILEEHCMDCHKAPHTVNGRTQKPKGDLRLDGRFFILKGGAGGRVLTPGQSAQSELYTRTILPKDHDDIMPPKGGPLPIGDRLVLKQWINEGAKFGAWVGAKPVSVARPAPPPAVKRSASAIDYTALSAGLAVPSARALDEVRKASRLSVMPLARGSALLRVDTATEPSAITDLSLSKLQPLAKHITHLKLGKTSITHLNGLVAYPRLIDLDVHGTGVSSESLARLGGLKRLERLNLHDTDIGDRAIPHLVKLRSLKRLYVWNTKMTPAGLKRLQGALPKTRIIAGNGLP